MIRKNSIRLEIQRPRSKKSQGVLDKKFKKAVDFMEWHSLEKNMLTNFKELISNEIIIYPQEITRIILLSKLDYQLTQLVNKLAEEINSNLVAFKELPYQKYINTIVKNACSKITLLIRTSSPAIRSVCEVLLFVHFVSQNLDNYSKILREYERKNINNKIQQMDNEYIFIMGYRVYTIVLLIYIKLNELQNIKEQSIFQRTISMREKYLQWKDGSYNKKNRMKSSGLSSSFKIYNSNFISITYYLAYEQIKYMIKYNQDKYQIMIKTNKYINKITFCRQKKTVSENVYKIFLENIKKLTQSIKEYINKNEHIISEMKKNNDDKELNVERKRYRSLEEEIKECERYRQFDKNLKDRFFVNNKSQVTKSNKRCRSLLSKHKVSKVKIMQELFKNNLQNTRNALLKVQLQMKTNKTNNDKLKQKYRDKDRSKSKLKKKKGNKNIYHKFKNSKNIVCDISLNLLEKQLQKLDNLKRWNQNEEHEREKKRIVQFQIKHKSHNSMTNSGFQNHQKIQKIQIFKIINGTCKIVSFDIKPKEKNLILQVKLPQIKLKLQLPRGQNIFNGRYHTIWPTVKYHIKKKILQYSVFKQHQTITNFLRQDGVSEEEKNNLITNQKLINMFGAVDEDEFNEICLALGYISKFIDFLISQKYTMRGSYHIAQEIAYQRMTLSLKTNNIYKNNSNFINFKNCSMIKGKRSQQTKLLDKSLTNSIYISFDGSVSNNINTNYAQQKKKSHYHQNLIHVEQNSLQLIQNEIRLSRIQQIFLCGLIVGEQDAGIFKQKINDMQYFIVEVKMLSKNFMKVVKYKQEIQLNIKYYKYNNQHNFTNIIVKTVLQLFSSKKLKAKGKAKEQKGQEQEVNIRHIKINIKIEELRRYRISGEDFILYVGGIIQSQKYMKHIQQKLICFIQQTLTISRQTKVPKIIIKDKASYYKTPIAYDHYSHNYPQTITYHFDFTQYSQTLYPITVIEESSLSFDQNNNTNINLNLDHIIQETPRNNETIKKLTKLKMNRLASAQLSDISWMDSCNSILQQPLYQSSSAYRYGYYSYYYYIVRDQHREVHKLSDGKTYDFNVKLLVSNKEKGWLILVQICKYNSMNMHKLYLSQSDISHICENTPLTEQKKSKKYNIFIDNGFMQQLMNILTNIKIEKVTLMQKVYLQINDELYTQSPNITIPMHNDKNLMRKQTINKKLYYIKTCKLSLNNKNKYCLLSLELCVIDEVWYWKIRLHIQRNKYESTLRVSLYEMLVYIKQHNNQHYLSQYLKIIKNTNKINQNSEAFTKEILNNIRVQYRDKAIHCMLFGRDLRMRIKLLQQYNQQKKCLYVVQLQKQMNDIDFHKFQQNNTLVVNKISKPEQTSQGEQTLGFEIIKDIIHHQKLQKLTKGFVIYEEEVSLTKLSQYYLSTFLTK